MNTLSSRAVSLALFLFAGSLGLTRADAVEALLLQDTYVDNDTTGGKPPPNGSNCASGIEFTQVSPHKQPGLRLIPPG